MSRVSTGGRAPTGSRKDRGELLAGAVKIRLDGAFRDSEDLRNLLHGKALLVLQDDRLAKIVTEVAEPFVSHRGGASTMPQKRNPISSELMLAASKAVRQHAGLMMDAMVQDFERATGPWHAEWVALPESFILTAGALHQAKFALGGLVVDEQRMRHNLGITKGLIVAEAVMMGLAPALGRQQAHDVVYDACRAVNDGGGTLAQALAALEVVTAHFSPAEIDRLTDPSNYLGLAPQMVDRAIALSETVDC